MILFLPALITTKNTNANRCLTFIGAFDCLSAYTFKRVHKNPSKIGLSVSKAHWKVMRFNQTMFFFSALYIVMKIFHLFACKKRIRSACFNIPFVILCYCLEWVNLLCLFIVFFYYKNNYLQRIYIFTQATYWIRKTKGLGAIFFHLWPD